MPTAMGCSTNRNLIRGSYGSATAWGRREDQCQQRIDEANQEVELRLVIGQLEELAGTSSQELQEPDWETRREIVQALVKKVEIDEQEVRIVYLVSPFPFEGSPQQGSL